MVNKPVIYMVAVILEIKKKVGHITYAAYLMEWMNGKKNSMPFAIIWSEATSYSEDCCLRLTKSEVFSKRKI
jgi:hypothetical protein